MRSTAIRRARDGDHRVTVRRMAPMVLLLAGVAALAAACGTTTSAAAPASAGETSSMVEYVGGHWVPFTSVTPLSAQQWSVIDSYANFTTAALDVYSSRSVAPIETVIAPQSTVTAMFAKFLAEGKNPEALYTKATVESVAISGCRAHLALALSYPGGRTLHYVSSWVRPFDRAAFTHHAKRASTLSGASTKLASASSTQYAPWLFVGDNRVGGVDAPCGV